MKKSKKANISQINWNRINNKKIRRFVYQQKLASIIEQAINKPVRFASRTEIAKFLKDYKLS